MATITLCSDGTRAHHWLLAPPESTTIPGQCIRCSATRDFHPFEDEDIKGRAASIRANHYAGVAQPSKTPEWVSGRRTTSSGKKLRSGVR